MLRLPRLAPPMTMHTTKAIHHPRQRPAGWAATRAPSSTTLAACPLCSVRGGVASWSTDRSIICRQSPIAATAASKALHSRRAALVTLTLFPACAFVTASRSAETAQGPAGSGIADGSKCSGGLTRGLPLNTFRTIDNRVALLWPCGWSQVQNLDPSYGILASFYNAKEPGVETLAVYSSPTDTADTEGLGTAEELGKQLAEVAPFGELLEHSSFQVDGTTYYVARVMFGGSTAGKFGAVMELRCVVVSKGTKYTLRVTTSRYRWLAYPEVPVIMDEVARSLRVQR